MIHHLSSDIIHSFDAFLAVNLTLGPSFDWILDIGYTITFIFLFRLVTSKMIQVTLG